MLVVPVLRAERKQTAPVLVPVGYFSSSGEPSMTIKPVLFLVGAAHLYAAMYDDAGLARPQYLCDSRTLVKK